MNAGVIDLLMRADMAKLAADMQQMKGMVSGSMKSVEDAVASAKKVLAALGIGFSAHVLIEKINSTIERMDALKNASEKTGASVEELSKLQFFAGISGSSIDGVTSALVKLSKGMAATGAEGAPTSQALKYLGLSAKDAAGNLKDPSALFGEISQKLIGYQDGAGKAAIAQALFGKAGAEMLPTLKKMAEIGDIEAAVTKNQAEASEAYNLEVAKLNRNKEILWNTIASALLPTMGTLVGQLLEASKQTDSLGGKVKGLAANHSIEDWADMGAMGVARLVDVLKTIPALISAVSSSFEVVYADLKVLATAGVLTNPVAFVAAKAAGTNPWDNFKDSLAERNKILADANAKYAALWNAEGNATEKSMAAAIAARKAAAAGGDHGAGDGPLKKLNFELVDVKAAARLAAAELKLYESSMQALEKTYFNLTHAGEVALIMYETTKGTLKKLTDEHKAELLVMAEKIDAYRRLVIIQEQAVERIKSLTAAQEAAKGVELDYAAAQRLDIDNMHFAFELMGKTLREQELMTAARQIDLGVRTEIAKLPKDEAGDLLPGAIAAAERMRQKADDQKKLILDGITARQVAERDWLAGSRAGFMEYVDNATNAALQAKNAITSGLKLMEDSLFTFLRHGTLGFKDFVSTVKDMLARLAAQQITVQIVGALGMSGAAGAAGAAGSSGMSGLSMVSSASGANTLSGWLGGPSVSMSNLFGGQAAANAAMASGYGASSATGAMVGGASATLSASEAASLGYAAVEGGSVAVSGGMMAGASAALAAIPVWGWIALAVMAVLASSGGGGPKTQQVLWDQANAGVGNNNITSQDPAFYAAAAAFSDKIRGSYSRAQLDAANLSGLSVEGAPGDNPMDLLANIQKRVLEALGPVGDLTKATENLAKAAADAAEAEKAAALASALALERRGLEIRLMDAQGDAAGALAARRQDETAAINEANRAILAQIYAAEDLATAAKAAADAELQAAQAAAALANERRGLEIRLMQAQGDAAGVLAAQRADELAGTNDLNKELLRQIYAAEDAAKAADELTVSQNNMQAELQKSADAFNQFAKSIQDTIDQLRGGDLSTLSPIQKLAEARTQLDTAFSGALSGNAEALTKLPQAATSFLTASRAYNASSSAYAMDFDQVMSFLARARDASAARGVVPGFASGLDTVPYDNFRANLHAGEAVLNRSAASAWRSRAANDDRNEMSELRRDMVKRDMQQQQETRDLAKNVKVQTEVIGNELRTIGSQLRRMEGLS